MNETTTASPEPSDAELPLTDTVVTEPTDAAVETHALHEEAPHDVAPEAEAPQAEMPEAEAQAAEAAPATRTRTAAAAKRRIFTGIGLLDGGWGGLAIRQWAGARWPRQPSRQQL